MARLKHIRLIHRQVPLGIVLFGLIFSSGCVSRTQEPELEIVRGGLQSRDGEWPLTTEKMTSKADAAHWNLVLVAESPELRVTLLPFASPPKLIVLPQEDGRTLSITGVNGFYERDYRDQQPFEFLPVRATDAHGHPIPALGFPAPAALTRLFTGHGHALPRADVARIKAMQDDVHRFYLEFRLDDEPYVLDAAFRLDTAGAWTVNLPTGGLP